MSLDNNETQPKKAKHDASWLIPVVVIVLILLGASGSVIFDKWQHSRLPVADPKITSIGDMTVKDGEVSIGKNGGSAWTPEYFIDGSGVPSREAVDTVIATGLKSVENLRTWRLCETELLAQSEALKGAAKAERDFPRNMPEDIDPAESAADAVRLDAEATLYAEAATLAGANNLPCTPEGASTRMPAVIFEVQHEGQTRQLAVTDYAVLWIMPLEYHLLTKNTVTKERDSRNRSAARKVDTTTVMYYNSEQAQASSLTAHDAVIKMLQAHPATNR